MWRLVDFLALNAYLFTFAVPNLMAICKCISEIIKTKTQDSFFGTKKHLNMCVGVDNFKWLFIIRKVLFSIWYLRFQNLQNI